MNLTINDLRCGNIVNYQTAEGDIKRVVIDLEALKWLKEDPKGFNLVYSGIMLTKRN